MILKSLLVIACTAIYVRAQQPCLHAPPSTHSFAASPLSCAHYTICMDNNVIVGPDQVCPFGMNFDPPSQTCGQTSCMECSAFGIQNLPHPTDCYQYIECILGNRRILTCPSGLQFDRTIGQCNEPHLVICPGDPTYPTDWPTDPTDWPTDPTDWPTDPTDWWPTDPTDWPPYPTDPPGGQEPVCRGQVFHAHPTNCNRFFMCMDEILWEHNCPSDLHWNQLINACDFPEFARCLAGGGTTTTEPPLWPPPDDTTLWPPPDDTTVWPPPDTTVWPPPDTTIWPPPDTTICPPEDIIPWRQPTLLPPRK